jgi:plastocyanin domain-containing protein
MKNYQYLTDPAVLKKGIPVKMTVDLNTVVGCATDIVIKDFGVRKYVSQGDNIITFTPTKTGTIGIACSMNMYHGTFTVVDEANPNAPAEVTASPITPASGGSCGAGGGGCGCGGGA